MNRAKRTTTYVLLACLAALTGPLAVLAGYLSDGGNGAVWREDSVTMRYYGPADYYPTVAAVAAEWNSIKPDKAPTLVPVNIADIPCTGALWQSILTVCITDIPSGTGRTWLYPNDKYRLGNVGVRIEIDPQATGSAITGWNSYLVRHEMMHAMTAVNDCPAGPANCRPDSTVQGQFPGFGTWDTGYADWVYDRWDCQTPNPRCN